MGRPASTRKCPACGLAGLKRNGTRDGRIRWRCTKCGASTSQTRTDQKELAQFERFLAWVRGPRSQADLDGTLTGRSFRHDIAWCWSVPIPKPPVTGEIHDQVFIDGTHLAYQWCLLVARSGNGTVVGWQWCHSENAASYAQMLSTIVAPTVVTTDGAGGALKAIKECWPQTRIQRCLLHVHRNNTQDLTRNPKTPAGRTLLALSQRLLKVGTKEEAAQWAALLATFHSQYRDYLKERTYAKNDPEGAQARGKKASGWWYTHERDRRVYYRLNRLYQAGELFAFLTTDAALERTTNPVESINHQIKRVIKAHPGLSEDHQACAIEWVLHSYTETPHTSRQILKDWKAASRPERHLVPKKPHPTRPLGPATYDTGLSADEGLWDRKGWGGRWQP